MTSLKRHLVFLALSLSMTAIKYESTSKKRQKFGDKDRNGKPLKSWQK